ncbi:MAG: fumarylacetoacetate hydrolase family protein [Smithellaceae bacterium]|nr:fumarylacetoacetate hydrolase family protein [Smithellaceae bacterium]
MKLIRFVDENATVRQGIYDPAEPEVAKVVQGNIASGIVSTNEWAMVKKLLAPVEPCNVFALGLNYRKHADETSLGYPSSPVVFMKASTSVAGPGEAIVLPAAGAKMVDFEAELAIIIGRRAKHVPSVQARDYIFGFTCANDVSARDWQFELQKGQWTRGKSFDTFCPLGPWLVTADEIEDPDRLSIRTTINGKTLQDSTTADMIFSVDSIVSDLSRTMTLLPGTVILTGTPDGVGFTRQPPVFLRPGDVVTVEIENVGRLTNPVEEEGSLS